MKTYRWILFTVLGLLALSLSAFVPAAQPILQTPGAATTPALPSPPPAFVVTPPPLPIPPTAGPSEPKPVSDARNELSQRLGVQEIQVQVVSVQPTTWPNACMGINLVGISCKPSPVPGYLITLTENNRDYVYHTDRAGNIVVLASVPGEVQQNQLLHWTRTGGVSGFCNALTIYQGGAVRAINCEDGVIYQVVHKQMPSSQFQILQGWINQYNSLSLHHTIPAPVNNEMIALQFSGAGNQSFDPRQMQSLFDYAASIFTWATSAPLPI